MSYVIGPEDCGQRLDMFLARRLPDMTRSQLQGLNRRGGIRVNGSFEKAGYRLRIRDSVEVDAARATPAGIRAEAIPLDVRYEDVHLAVIEKPAGMVVHPGAGHTGNTLAHALMARFPGVADVGDAGRPGVVHRLDKWTSGLIVIARTPETHHRLTAAFRLRQVRKEYVALVHGCVRQDSGVIELGIRRHPSVRTRMSAHTGGGRTAHTEYRVLERSPQFTLLAVRIRTGRTHQIRVHLRAIGHPVVGDATYGGKLHGAFVRKHGDPGRYFLHAAKLGFPHPHTGEPMSFESPLPADLDALWAQLKRGSAALQARATGPDRPEARGIPDPRGPNPL